jgi:hypothetical protein
MKFQKPVKMFGIWIQAEKGMGHVWRIDNLLPIIFMKIIPIKLGFKPISF